METVMPKQGDVHVVPSENSWRVEVKRPGPATLHAQDAIGGGEGARQIARSNQPELLIHGRNGRVRDRSTYRRDPRQIKG